MENTNKTYLHLLIDTMKKKAMVLDRMIKSSQIQANCFQGLSLDEDTFDKNLEEKDQMILELNQLNDGFERIYQRVNGELQTHKNLYETEIKELQRLIKQVTEKSLQIQNIEASNRLKFEAYISNQKKNIKSYTMSKKSVAAYYNNMMRQANDESYFYDKKK